MTGAALWDVLNRCRANQFCLNSISSNPRRITGISRNPEQSIGSIRPIAPVHPRSRLAGRRGSLLTEPLAGVGAFAGATHGPAGGEKDREVVSVDSRLLITRFVDPDAAKRYGYM